jgi:WD40 repeat protein
MGAGIALVAALGTGCTRELDPIGTVVALDENDAGTVVGCVVEDGIRSGFLIAPGQTARVPLVTGTGEPVCPMVINGPGDILGSVGSGSGYHSVIRRSGTWSDLPAPHPSGGATYARDLNDNGLAVGTAEEGPGGPVRPVAWDTARDRVSLLATSSPQGGEQVWAVNDHGLIVGSGDGSVVVWDTVDAPRRKTNTTWFGYSAVDVDEAGVVMLTGLGKSGTQTHGVTSLLDTTTGEWRTLSLPDRPSFFGRELDGQGRIVGDAATSAGGEHHAVRVTPNGASGIVSPLEPEPALRSRAWSADGRGRVLATVTRADGITRLVEWS